MVDNVQSFTPSHLHPMKFLKPIIFSVITFSCTLGAQAAMLVYEPFDSGASASLANAGTLGGTATVVDGPGTGSYIPTSSTSVAPGIGSTYSEQFTGSGTSAGAVVLPNSTGAFRLDGTNKMTLSTWVYWNGALAAGQLSGIASNIVSTSTSGWGLSITETGELRFEYYTQLSATERAVRERSRQTHGRL